MCLNLLNTSDFATLDANIGEVMVVVGKKRSGKGWGGLGWSNFKDQRFQSMSKFTSLRNNRSLGIKSHTSYACTYFYYFFHKSQV